MKYQSIQSTAFPCGTVRQYLHGMEQPAVSNYGAAMKKAAFERAQLDRETPGFTRHTLETINS